MGKQEKFPSYFRVCLTHQEGSSYKSINFYMCSAKIYVQDTLHLQRLVFVLNADTPNYWF